MSLSFHINFNGQCEEAFSFYAESLGEQTLHAPQRTFWSPSYAIVVDRFGVPWKINCGT